MAWAPPDTPDPSEILDSARKDTLAGWHADALAKFLWFHHNALRYRDSLAGVRLSFALSGWLDLGGVYPPARAAFLRTRDDAEAACAAEPGFEPFHDLAALNGYLGDGRRTADVFAAIARRSPAIAELLYTVAERYLVAAGRFAECGPFLAPEKRMWLAGESYKVMAEYEAGLPDGEDQPPKLARAFYVRDAATLVALLVLNGRTAEASQARVTALAVLDDEEFRTVLAAAMSGHLPPDPVGW
jgi:hypothetical protein